MIVFLCGCRAAPPAATVPPEHADEARSPGDALSAASTPAGDEDADRFAEGRAGAAEPAEAAPRRLKPFPGVVVLPDGPAVELTAWVCLEYGWLEQIACAPGTREHESLVVPRARPSQIHAALLMAGFEPGAPGTWFYENEQYTFTPPAGTALDVFVRYDVAGGGIVEEPIRAWIRDHHGRHEFPDEPWIFAGSIIAPNPDWMEEAGEHYVADVTGSIIGLVTFGDEVIGFSRVLADQAAVQPPEWEVNAEHSPPVGTEVTIILRRRIPDR